MSEFYGFVKGNVQERIIQCWMDDENISREHAISCYADNDFYKLCDRLKYICKFSFDGESQTDCFESVDNNFVIPVEIIDEVPSDYAELKKERDELRQNCDEVGKLYNSLFELCSSVEKERDELKAELEVLSDGITAQCELDAEKDKIISHIANNWDWTMQCEQDTKEIDQLRIDYGVSGYKDIELMVFMECHKRDMEERAGNE